MLKNTKVTDLSLKVCVIYFLSLMENHFSHIHSVHSSTEMYPFCLSIFVTLVFFFITDGVGAQERDSLSNSFYACIAHKWQEEADPDVKPKV